MYKNKHGQIEIAVIFFIIVLIGVLILAPFMIKIVNSVLTPMGNTLGNYTDQAGVNVRAVQTSFLNMWDFVIIIFFLINILLLWITSFLIDTHPLFILVYIFLLIIIFAFTPTIYDIVDTIWNDTNIISTSEIAQYLPMLNFIKDYFGIILLMILIISGVIIYAKPRIFGK